MTPKQTDPQFKLRLPGALKARVERAAAVGNRSINAEIVNALEKVYPAPVGPESVNAELLALSREALDTLATAISALGQDPMQNERVKSLSAAVKRAEKQR